MNTRLPDYSGKSIVNLMQSIGTACGSKDTRYPQLAALPGHYRQVPVPFCSDGQPLAGPVDGAPPGLWAFSGFSGAFTAVPPLAETLAESVAASLAGPLTKEADRINHGGATPL